MTIKEEQLSEVEKFAGLGCTPREIAIILQVPTEEFYRELMDEQSNVYSRYHRGLLLAVCQVREAVLNSAISGSGPAQAEMRKYFQKAIVELKQITGEE